MEKSMKRLAMYSLTLLAMTALPGCVFAIGSNLETDQTHRMDKLEKRISTAESTLGIKSPPPVAGVAGVQK